MSNFYQYLSVNEQEFYNLLESNNFACNAAGRAFMAEHVQVLRPRPLKAISSYMFKEAEKLGGLEPGQTFEYPNAQGGTSVARVCSLYDLPANMKNTYLYVFSGVMTAPFYGFEILRFYYKRTKQILPFISSGKEGNKGLFKDVFYRDAPHALINKTEYDSYYQIMAQLGDRSWVYQNYTPCEDDDTAGNLVELYEFAKSKGMGEITFVICSGNPFYDKRLLAEWMLQLKDEKFKGKDGITIEAGKMVASDAIDFKIAARDNVAITIHYGECDNKIVTGHPGSRTTSYLVEGNSSDFSKAKKTNHWYTICGIDVIGNKNTRAVAILGNSITDGRGSTTNQQDRWPDVFSRALLANPKTKDVAVLNLGIGGNCILRGGLGPTGASRFTRDIMQQEGVKYIVIFEGINDLGGSRNGEQTANALIEAYKKMIAEAHAKGIKVYGGTITPFKGNNYYTADHEAARKKVNTWIRTSGAFDAVIDFDKIIRDSANPEALQSKFLYENDWLHPNADGYKTMGSSIDLKLFQ